MVNAGIMVLAKGLIGAGAGAMRGDYSAAAMRREPTGAGRTTLL